MARFLKIAVVTVACVVGDDMEESSLLQLATFDLKRLKVKADEEMEIREFANDVMVSTGETNMDDVSFTDETMSAIDGGTMTDVSFTDETMSGVDDGPMTEAPWTLIAGNLKQVSVGLKPTAVWGVNSRDDIYYRQGKDGSWQQVGGKLVHVSVNGRNGEYVWGVNSGDDIYFREGISGRLTQSGHRRWEHVAGKLTQISVGQSGHVWGVNRADSIYYRNGFTGHWQGIGGKLVYVSVGGSNGEHVWGVNRGDNIYYRNGVGGAWTQIPGKLVVVEVSDQGEVYGVNRAGSIYKREDGHWVNVPGRLSHVDIGGSRKQTKYVWGANSGGAIFFKKCDSQESRVTNSQQSTVTIKTCDTSHAGSNGDFYIHFDGDNQKHKLQTRFNKFPRAQTNNFVVMHDARANVQKFTVSTDQGDGLCATSIVVNGQQAMGQGSIWIDKPCTSYHYDGTSCHPSYTFDLTPVPTASPLPTYDLNEGNVCKHGYNFIRTKEDCRNAAKVVKLAGKFGVFMKKDREVTNRPTGCYMQTNAKQAFSYRRVIYNTHGGAAHTQAMIICKKG